MKCDLKDYLLTVEGKLFENKKRILLDIVDSLLYFNSNKIIHGDLKPQNILIDFSNKACVGDFGTAAMISSTSKFGEIYALTSNYASPEMLVDEQMFLESDIWSFGAIILEVLFGYKPF